MLQGVPYQEGILFRKKVISSISLPRKTEGFLVHQSLTGFGNSHLS